MNEWSRKTYPNGHIVYRTGAHEYTIRKADGTYFIEHLADGLHPFTFRITLSDAKKAADHIASTAPSDDDYSTNELARLINRATTR